MEGIHLVKLTELEKILAELILFTATLFHLLVNLADGIVAAKLIFILGGRLNGLHVCVGKSHRRLRILGANCNLDDARVADKLKLG